MEESMQNHTLKYTDWYNAYEPAKKTDPPHHRNRRCNYGTD